MVNNLESEMSEQQRQRLEHLLSIEFPTPNEDDELRELLSAQTDDFIARTRG